MNSQEKEYLKKLKTIEELKIGVLQQIGKAADKDLQTDEILGAIESAKHLAQKLLDNKIEPKDETKTPIGYR